MIAENIVVTKHAIKKYRERSFNWNMSDQEAKEDLIRFVERGKVVQDCPGGAVKIKCDNQFIVASIHDNCVYVITYLGDGFCRWWFRNNVRTMLNTNKFEDGYIEGGG